MLTWSVNEIKYSELGSRDLLTELAHVRNEYGVPSAWRVDVFRDGILRPELAAEMLIFDAIGRVGFEWGAPSEWADTSGIDPQDLPSLFLVEDRDDD
mgnify:CR=1 FL=1